MKDVHNKSILIVDDDVRMLRALEKVLTAEGYAVLSATWVGDAVDIVVEQKKKIDLVITDLRMPLVTGITGVFAIHRVLPHLPIVVLTAFGSPEVKAECLRLGATDFLEKPLDTPHLLEVIARIFAAPETNSSPDRPLDAEQVGKSS
jgi:DNA-binding NtrC family response regulator